MTLRNFDSYKRLAAAKRYNEATIRAMAKVVFYGAVEQLLNSIISAALVEQFEKEEQERVVTLANFHKAKPSRRTYYAVYSKEVDGEWIAKLYCKKPKPGADGYQVEYTKIRAAKKSEARLILDAYWNQPADVEARRARKAA